MKTEKLKINNIPAIIWGEKSEKVFIAVHGNMSSKEDDVIQILAEIATKNGFQVLSFDLPEHGERKNENDYLCKVQNCIFDLKQIMNFVKKNYSEINLWACSMGAFFSLLAYKNEKIKKCLFLSPIVNMKVLVDDMMKCSNINEDILKEKQEIKTNFGQTLYYDYYTYIKENPITTWNTETHILYGDKDNLQSHDLIQKFTKNYNCKLLILKNGEHFFHTKKQLDFYKNWLNEIF